MMPKECVKMSNETTALQASTAQSRVSPILSGSKGVWQESPWVALARDIASRHADNAAALQLRERPFVDGEVRPKGVRVFVDEMTVQTLVGIHAHEKLAPQPVVFSLELLYGCHPRESSPDAFIDYESLCNRLCEFLAEKEHTNLLETLSMEMASVALDEFPAIEALTLVMYKPRIRKDSKRVGVEFRLTRADYEDLRD
jgi:7,8-dihydroneopterin aldolase/epimerase/oxygenase